MASFPDGNFTITNNETGRCLRVRLGRSEDVSDYKEGTKYLQTVTAKPWLELGEPDGSIATAWYFRTVIDPLEKVPVNQIASVAVSDLQNIGDYCVWLRVPFLDDATAASKTAYRQLPAVMESREPGRVELMGSKIPAQWTGSQRHWEQWWMRYLIEGEQAPLDSAVHGSRASWKGDRAEFIAALNSFSAHARPELEAAAKASGNEQSRVADATTELRGCGASRGDTSTYRWATDGRYIYGADDTTVPSSRTYWTDLGSQLAGCPRGRPGQSWTIKPWNPPPPPADDGEAIIRTGLFGPIGTLLGL
ncbi:hypothetical protein [Nocardia goodfellowii]|uniref:Uncharacterized protein n=1 Tax=Nocardia goodfellowii TaxID=882446 RepID=A0ABS4QML9_9NOCA|nr:hypothetical protein [Nocardia goodfellowii]MBP2192952.1 hypothetical protein [Nocardia goodfellowii]